MGISRREALKLAGAGAMLSAAPSLVLAAGTDRSLYPSGDLVPWPILQGPTDDRSASFVVLLPDGYPLNARVLDDRRHALPWRVASRFAMPDIALATTEIVVTGLTPGAGYTLELLDPNGIAFDRRRFGALDLARRRCRFALASCMLDSHRREAVTMWEAMAREACDFVMLAGDTCYADMGNSEHTESGYRRRYCETRLTLSWFLMERLVPTFAVWDDHDFGINNGDRTFPLAPVTRALFRAFWGSTENSAWRTGPGVASGLEAFGQRFYLLDSRSYRDPRGTPSAQHWGAEQTEWLLEDIARSPRPAWLMNGTQFFGPHPISEGVEAQYPEALHAVTDRLARLPAPAVFASGDVHYSEIRHVRPRVLGYDSYEFTSSSIHSIPPVALLNRGDPDRLALTRRHNFMVLDVDTADGWAIRCRSVAEGNRVMFDEAVTVAR